MPAGGQGCNPLSSIPLDFQSHREEPAIQRADVNELPHFLWATLYFLSSRLLVCLPRASHNPPGRLVPWMQQLKSGPPHSANSCRFPYIKNFRDRILLCPKPTGSSTLSWRAGLRCAQTRLILEPSPHCRRRFARSRGNVRLRAGGMVTGRSRSRGVGGLSVIALCLAVSLSLPLLSKTSTADPCIVNDAFGDPINICPVAGQETVNVTINGTNYTGEIAPYPAFGAQTPATFMLRRLACLLACCCMPVIYMMPRRHQGKG